MWWERGDAAARKEQRGAQCQYSADGAQGWTSLSGHWNSVCIISRTPPAALAPDLLPCPGLYTLVHTLCALACTVPPRQVTPVSFRRRGRPSN